MKYLFIFLALFIPSISFAAQGDIYYGSTTYPITVALPIGSNGTCMTSTGAIPQWGTCTGSSSTNYFSNAGGATTTLTIGSILQMASFNATSTTATSSLGFNAIVNPTNASPAINVVNNAFTVNAKGVSTIGHNIGEIGILVNNSCTGVGSTCFGNFLNNVMGSGNPTMFGYYTHGESYDYFSGNVDIGGFNSQSSHTLTVDGNEFLTGAFYDSTESTGSNGQILQTNGSATTWVSTSTLGLLSSSSLPWSVSNGGTGSTSYAVGNILLGSSTNPIYQLPASTSGSVLQSQGSGLPPKWVATSSLGISGGTGTNGCIGSNPCVATSFLATGTPSVSIEGPSTSSPNWLINSTGSATFLGTALNFNTFATCGDPIDLNSDGSVCIGNNNFDIGGSGNLISNGTALINGNVGIGTTSLDAQLNINLPQASPDTNASDALDIYGQKGGNYSSSQAGTGAAINIIGGAGGDGDDSNPAGNGAAVTISGGAAGADNGGGSGSQGQANIIGGGPDGISELSLVNEDGTNGARFIDKNFPFVDMAFLGYQSGSPDTTNQNNIRSGSAAGGLPSTANPTAMLFLSPGIQNAPWAEFGIKQTIWQPGIWIFPQGLSGCNNCRTASAYLQVNGFGTTTPPFMVLSSTSVKIITTSPLNSNVGFSSSTPGATISDGGTLQVASSSILATTTVTNFTAIASSTLATTTATNLTVTGQTTLATASSTGLTVTATSTLTGLNITNLTSTFLAVDANHNVIATTTPTVSSIADAWTRVNGGIYAGDSLASTSQNVGIGTTTPSAILAVQASSTGNNTIPEFVVASSTGSTTLSVLASGSVCVGTKTCTDAMVVSNVAIPRITLGPGTATNNDALYNIRSVGTGNAYVSLTKNAVADEFHYGWNGSNSNYEFGTGGTMGSNIDQTVTTGGLFNFLKNVGFGSTTPGTTVAIQAAANVTPLVVASSTGSSIFTVAPTGAIIASGTIPTVATSTGAGTSATASITGVQNGGIITINTSGCSVTCTASVSIATTTYPTKCPTGSSVIITAANATTQGLSGVSEPYAIGGTTSWVLQADSTGLSNSTTYSWNYSVTCY